MQQSGSGTQSSIVTPELSKCTSMKVNTGDVHRGPHLPVAESDTPEMSAYTFLKLWAHTVARIQIKHLVKVPL